MWFTKRVLFLWAFCSLTFQGQGQILSGTVTGFTGESVMLSYFSGDQRFVVDTIRVRNGEFEISLNYPPGFYSLIFDREHFFDLYVYDGIPNSRFTADFEELDATMLWTGCQENLAFLKFRQQGLDIGNRVNDGSLSPENASGIFSSWEEQWKLENKTLQIVRFLGARDPMADIAFEPSINFRKWSQSYWQQCALNDPAMIRSPFLLRNLDFYFDKVCPPVPDSVVAAIEVLFSGPIAAGVLDILVSKLTIRFEGSKVMGMDKAFVAMVDKFYRTGIATWESEENLQKIVRKADELSWNLIGSVSPDFEFIQADGRVKKLSEFRGGGYHVLYFWDATCGHCQTTTPVLQDFYNRFKSSGLEVIAITTESDLTDWKKYIADNNLVWTNGYDNRFSQINFRHYYYIPTTPLVLLLDGKGTIVAKNISIADLERIVSERLNQES
jgi:thiol-disulfide isomerase/thioredoxin